MKNITFFSDKSPKTKVLGGKGTNLIKLTNIGVNVPPGFIINTNAYDDFLDKSAYNGEFLEKFSQDFTAKQVMNISTELKEFIMESNFPSELIEELNLAYTELLEDLKKNISVAVRSSATIEDSSRFSFAGQADSFLYNNTFEDILLSLKKCWASLYSPRALLYLLQMKRRGIDIILNDVRMAVVIQKMVNSDISGVLFTANIVNNDENQMLINSAWGLGGPIADNSINPDTIILNKSNFKIIKTIIGEKEKRSIRNPEASGTIMVENDPNTQSKCSLNKEQLEQIHKIGLKIESQFSYPQDIEFALENNIIYILQTRPITTLKRSN